MELSCPQNLFYILDKTPLGEAMLKQPLLFTGCSNIQFFNSFFVTYGTPCRTRGHHSRLIFCDLRDTMPCQRSPLLFPTKQWECASAYILSLLATSLINNSGLIFIYVKVMNVFSCGEQISKLAD